MPRVMVVWVCGTALILAFAIGILTESIEETPASVGAAITWGLLSVVCLAYAAGQNGRR